MATPVWLEYVEPFATVLAAVIAIYAAADARKSAAAQRQDTELQNGETKRQSAVALETMLVDYHRTILAWGDESIEWMSQAHSLTFYGLGKMEENAFYSRRAECLWHLSALLIEVGSFSRTKRPTQSVFTSPKRSAASGLSC